MTKPETLKDYRLKNLEFVINALISNYKYCIYATILKGYTIQKDNVVRLYKSIKP